MSQRRALPGGELGANGERYAGGQWLNTVAANDKRTQVRQPRRAPVLNPRQAELTVAALRRYAAMDTRDLTDEQRSEIRYLLRCAGDNAAMFTTLARAVRS